jgi:hypothetical protein
MAAADTEAALKRLGGGRWQTRDERFTIEPQSGTWVVVDADQVDDLGLPLVRGPFGSLGAAKAAIAEARASEPASSPLPARAERLQGQASATSTDASPSNRAKGPAAKGPAAKSTTPSRPSKPAAAAAPEPAEPRWITELEAGERRRARRLLERLTDASAPDPEGIARRDIVGQVPAVAAHAIARRIHALGRTASPSAVAAVLIDGRDDELGVRWRLVDGEGRPITVDLETPERTPDP